MEGERIQGGKREGADQRQDETGGRNKTQNEQVRMGKGREIKIM